MVLCAIDIGLSNIGCVVIDNNIYVSSELWKAPKLDVKDYDARISACYKFYETLLKVYHPDLVILEKPVGAKSVQAVKAMWVAYTTALISCKANNIEVVSYSVKTIKAWMIREFGANDKQLAQEYYKSKENLTKANEHIADAYILWCYYENRRITQEINQ